MDTVSVLPGDIIGKNFVSQEFLPEGKDEYYIRNLQSLWPKNRWRNLLSSEVEILIKNNNLCADWNEIFVTEPFNPESIRNNQFFGLVRIGKVRNVILEHHDLKLAAGITNSIIISSDIGDDVAIHNVGYLSHFIIGDRCILSNVNEMNTSNHAKFGNGIIKEGESEDVRVWLELMNETGCRAVAPFDGMITADAYLWAKYRDDEVLQNHLTEITQNSFDNHRGFYGLIGNQCIIKNSRVIKDVKIGPYCYIKGANKLKNLTINSSEQEPTQIGEGVELVNGIIGYGCHIFYGCKAVRFVLGDNSNLKYGARLLNSFLGDNSTISCCEVLNNLIFPAHEQHHNNSFLIASLVMGQSNLAAGATVGSNHNSRANDNEVQAGRGFWPGLCTSIKHSSRFASYVLLSKADYPAELNIPLPFSLLNNNTSKDQLEVTPAFWWTHNMYALERNSWKFKGRDKRRRKIQNIEFDVLAPDTIEEIFTALHLLEIWTAKADIKRKGETADDMDNNQLAAIGHNLLNESGDHLNNLEIHGENMEKTKRKVVIVKTLRAYHAYLDMLYYYAVKNILEFMKADDKTNFLSMCNVLKSDRVKNWVNLGGQLMPETDADQIRADIRFGKLNTWADIHKRYDRLWSQYPIEKHKHAYATLCDLLGISILTKEQWLMVLDKAVLIQEFIKDQVYLSRKKDFENPYRQLTFRNAQEMKASIGTIDDNSFVKEVQKVTIDFKAIVSEIKERG